MNDLLSKMLAHGSRNFSPAIAGDGIGKHNAAPHGMPGRDFEKNLNSIGSSSKNLAVPGKSSSSGSGNASTSKTHGSSLEAKPVMAATKKISSNMVGIPQSGHSKYLKGVSAEQQRSTKNNKEVTEILGDDVDKSDTDDEEDEEEDDEYDDDDSFIDNDAPEITAKMHSDSIKQMWKADNAGPKKASTTSGKSKMPLPPLKAGKATVQDLRRHIADQEEKYKKLQGKASSSSSSSSSSSKKDDDDDYDSDEDDDDFVPQDEEDDAVSSGSGSDDDSDDDGFYDSEADDPEEVRAAKREIKKRPKPPVVIDANGREKAMTHTEWSMLKSATKMADRFGIDLDNDPLAQPYSGKQTESRKHKSEPPQKSTKKAKIVDDEDEEKDEQQQQQQQNSALDDDDDDDDGGGAALDSDDDDNAGGFDGDNVPPYKIVAKSIFGPEEENRVAFLLTEINRACKEIMAALYGQIVIGQKPISSYVPYYYEQCKRIREMNLIKYLHKVLAAVSSNRKRSALGTVLQFAVEALPWQSETGKIYRAGNIATSEVAAGKWLEETKPVDALCCVCGNSIIDGTSNPASTVNAVDEEYKFVYIGRIKHKREKSKDDADKNSSEIPRHPQLKSTPELRGIFHICKNGACEMNVLSIDRFSAIPQLLAMHCLAYLCEHIRAKGEGGTISSSADLVETMLKTDEFKLLTATFVKVDKIVWSLMLV